MRILKLNLIAVALLLFGATSANAFAVNMVARNATSSLGTSDTVTVDVFFDATAVGIRLFSVAVLGSDATVLSYNAVASAALPIIHPAPPMAYGTTGAEPGYILYNATTGGMPPTPSVQLNPLQTPAWLTWPAPPVGQVQVNINYTELNITDTFDTRTTGNNIWIGSMVFHINQAFTSATLSLAMLDSNILQLGDVVLDPNTIALSAPITLTGHLPEPTTAMLMGLGLLGLAISGRRQS